MKLIDALKEIKNNHNKYVQYKDSYFGYRYMNDYCLPFDCYVMKYMDTDKKIVFFDKDLFVDGWEIHTGIKPRYKIGDRFLLSDLYYSETKTDGSISKTTLKNTIGEIIASYYDGKEMQYTISLNGKGFPLLLTEDYLNKLDMVVSQN